jgi:hypothetical protein
MMGYRLGANWSRGDYTGTLENVTPYVAREVDVVASWGRSDPRATSDATSGKMSFTLNNHQRYFSPENGASPIAGRVLSGTPARLTVDDAATGTTTTVFSAPIDTFGVDSNGAAKPFAAECLDGWGKPGDTQLSTQVYQGKRTGDLIGIILDQIGWPADKRVIDAGVTLVPYWWAEGVDAATAVTDLVHSEGPPAIAYVQAGIFYFRDRHHRVTLTSSLTSQGTYTHIVPAGAIGTDHKILRDTFSYDHGLDFVVNTAQLEVTPRVPGEPGVVWSSTDPVVLSGGQAATLVIRTDDPFTDLQIPSAAVTYLDDGGVLTSDYTVAQGSATFSLSRTSGQSAFLTITAGGGGVVINTGVKVRGTPVVAGATRVFSASDTGSQATYGINDWGGSAPWAYFYDAEAIVNQVVSIYARPMPSVEFQVDARASSWTKTAVLGLTIGTRITVRNDVLGINADYIVEQITHTVRSLGVRHLVTIGAQLAAPVQASNAFTFDVAGRGFNQGQFALDLGNNPTTMFRFDTSGQGFDQGVFAS